MPVVINNQTGLAESLPDNQANIGLQSGSHSLLLNDPEGNPVTSTLVDAPELLQQGYKAAPAEHLDSALRYAKYSTPDQRNKAFVEGFAKDASLGFATKAELMAGVKPEDIKGREDVQSTAELAGRATGLGVTSLIGLGEGALLGKAGKAIASGLMGAEIAPTAGILSKMAYNGIKNATEFAVMQGGNEVNKAFLKDPDSSLGNAIVNIGTSALFGGTFGGLGRGAFEVAKDTKLGQTLSLLKAKVLSESAASEVGKTAQGLGIDLDPKVSAAMSGSQELKDMASTLAESPTKAGAAMRESLGDTRKQLTDTLLDTLGKTPEDLEPKSNYDLGKSIQDTLVDGYKNLSKPVSELYEGLSDKFKGAKFGFHDLSDITEKLSSLSQEEGHSLRPDSPAMRSINGIKKDLLNVNNLDQLKSFTSSVSEELRGKDEFRLLRQVSGILRESEQTIIERELKEQAPELVEQLSSARSGYKDLMGMTDELADRLRPGNFKGPESFIRALQEMRPEEVLNRLKGTNDAGLLNILKERFPQVLEHVKEFHVGEAVAKGGGRLGGEVSFEKVLSSVNKWSPELKNTLLSAEQQAEITDAAQLMSKMPKKINTSGTARMLDALWKRMPGGIMSMMAAFTGHNPVGAYVAGQMGRAVSREIPDAFNLGLLKFLGSDMPVETGAFKSMLKFISSMYKGANMMDKASEAVFKGGEVIPVSFTPKQSALDNLNKHVIEANANAQSLVSNNDDIAHYLPEYAMASGAMQARAVLYLNSIRPHTGKTSVLDMDRKPSKLEESEYNRQLKIVEQPAMIYKHIADGTITPKDIQTLQTVYPQLLGSMRNQLQDKMFKHMSKNDTVPYKVALGLGLFLGHPLESSTMPANAMANAQVGVPSPESQQMQPQGKQGRPKGSPNKLSDMPEMSATPGQAAERAKLARK